MVAAGPCSISQPEGIGCESHGWRLQKAVCISTSPGSTQGFLFKPITSQPHDTANICLSTICEFLMVRTLSAYLSILTTSPVMTRYSVNLTHHSFKNKVAHVLTISGKLTGVCVAGGRGAGWNYKTFGICTCTDFKSLGIWRQQYTLKISN